MWVLTDPATCGILNSELTNCPRTSAVLGDLAAQWQQMMVTFQRVERETVSSQSLANIEKMSKTRVDATGNRLRLKDGERLPRQQLYFHFPTSLSAQRWLSKSLLTGCAHLHFDRQTQGKRNLESKQQNRLLQQSCTERRSLVPSFASLFVLRFRPEFTLLSSGSSFPVLSPRQKIPCLVVSPIRKLVVVVVVEFV